MSSLQPINRLANELPEIWKGIQRSDRDSQIDVEALKGSAERRDDALKALKLGLEILANLPTRNTVSPLPDRFPDIGSPWGAFLSFCGEEITRIDRFDSAVLRRALARFVDDPAPMLDAAINHWLWAHTSRIVDGACRGLEGALRKKWDAPESKTLLELAETYWSRLDKIETDALLAAAAFANGAASYPLLEKIIADPSASPKAKDQAAYLRRAVEVYDVNPGPIPTLVL